MLSEFDLIRRYFTRPGPTRAVLGVGDDCALLAPRPGTQLAISTDMLVEGRHFFAGADPQQLGHKCLAVNLSDIAAMGARPLAFTLSLALPAAQPAWLEPFARGLFALADAHGCELIGGDTTKGPLNICITVLGETRPGHALRRDAAQAGDDVWVSGSLGDARLALAGYLNEVPLAAEQLDQASARMHQPTPRIALGRLLAGGEDGPMLARAALDISDGFAGDLRHILDASNVGATIDIDALPAGPVLSQQARDLRRCFCASGGDDYELCFTAAPARRAAIDAAAAQAGVAVTRVGRIDPEHGLRWIDGQGQPLDLNLSGFDHFA